jgi:chromosome segregation ATPase
MAINSPGRSDYKFSGVELPAVQAVPSELTCLFRAKICDAWGVDQGDLDVIVSTCSTVQEKIQEALVRVKGIQLELEMLRKAILLKEEMLKTRLDKLLAIQGKLHVLEVQFKESEEALNALTVKRDAIHAEFYELVGLEKNKRKISANQKSRLNKNWPSVNKAKSSIDVEFQKLLEKYEACKGAVCTQKSCVETITKEMESGKLYAHLQGLKEKLANAEKRREGVEYEIAILTVSMDSAIDSFIEAHIAADDLTLQGKVRAALKQMASPV